MANMKVEFRIFAVRLLLAISNTNVQESSALADDSDLENLGELLKHGHYDDKPEGPEVETPFFTKDLREVVSDTEDQLDNLVSNGLPVLSPTVNASCNVEASEAFLTQFLELMSTDENSEKHFSGEDNQTHGEGTVETKRKRKSIMDIIRFETYSACDQYQNNCQEFSFGSVLHSLCLTIDENGVVDALKLVCRYDNDRLNWREGKCGCGKAMNVVDPQMPKKVVNGLLTYSKVIGLNRKLNANCMSKVGGHCSQDEAVGMKCDTGLICSKLEGKDGRKFVNALTKTEYGVCRSASSLSQPL